MKMVSCSTWFPPAKATKKPPTACAPDATALPNCVKAPSLSPGFNARMRSPMSAISSFRAAARLVASRNSSELVPNSWPIR